MLMLLQRLQSRGHLGTQSCRATKGCHLLYCVGTPTHRHQGRHRRRCQCCWYGTEAALVLAETCSKMLVGRRGARQRRGRGGQVEGLDSASLDVGNGTFSRMDTADFTY